MPKVSPDILRWARETAGLTTEEAAKKLRLDPKRGVSAVDRLVALEAGADAPTRPMLVRMAKQYHRPLLAFYMSAPPQRGDRGQDFRTLPEGRAVADEALLDALIRDIQARQSMVRAVLEDEEEAVQLPFVASMEMGDGVAAVLASIRETLQVTQSDFRSQPDPLRAFNFLRAATEAIGVFVILKGNLGSHHTNIELQTFRGFALADPVAPFVIINDVDARAAWSFTLLHELAHLWLGQTGVSGSQAELAIEQFCNSVASEFLLPESELRDSPLSDRPGMDTLEREVSEFARARNLSSSMVAYRLYRAGTLSRAKWQRLETAFRDRWMEERRKQRERARDQDGGPSFYVVRGHRVGPGLINLVGRMMAAGAITTTKAGKVLGVRGKQVQTLLDSISQGATQQSA
ncbi:MAG: ImmA/IrrE family metallo-endopeptidase [Nitrospiraceae bacterium]|nr:ImmA/IrrE family metallo-endopeptidase [Nitrospiraceae bacterium]